jgi:hypothetical protein
LSNSIEADSTLCWNSLGSDSDLWDNNTASDPALSDNSKESNLGCGVTVKTLTRLCKASLKRLALCFGLQSRIFFHISGSKELSLLEAWNKPIDCV